MALSGKSGKSGKGKIVGKRHKTHKPLSPTTMITKPALRRIARRGGITRVSSDSYEVMNSALLSYLRTLLSKANTHVEHGKRKTVSVTDVAYALKHMGTRIMGFY